MQDGQEEEEGGEQRQGQHAGPHCRPLVVGSRGSIASIAAKLSDIVAGTEYCLTCRPPGQTSNTFLVTICHVSVTRDNVQFAVERLQFRGLPGWRPGLLCSGGQRDHLTVMGTGGGAGVMVPHTCLASAPVQSGGRCKLFSLALRTACPPAGGTRRTGCGPRSRVTESISSRGSQAAQPAQHPQAAGCFLRPAGPHSRANRDQLELHTVLFVLLPGPAGDLKHVGLDTIR